MRSKVRLMAVSVLASAALLGLAACGGGGGEPFGGQNSSGSATGGADATGGSGQTVVVGGANFTEMQIMQAIYVALLENEGYQTETVTAGQREVYFPELSNGAIDVVPEYAATLAEYLNIGANGKDAKPVATNDPQQTVEAMRPLAEKENVVILDPAKAADQNGFAVTKDFSEKNGVTTLSQLGALGQPVVLAAAEECPDRPFCGPGLEKTYGIKVSKYMPTGFSTPQTKQAVKDGEAQLGLVATTDGTLGQFDLVLLQDDKQLQLADNLVPAVNSETAKDTKLVDALNKLAGVLTTEDLAQLNAQVDGQRLKPQDVAEQYLKDKGLIG